MTGPAVFTFPGGPWSAEEPWHEQDPRLAYPGMSAEESYAAWPCADCRVRRDEHASESIQGRFPELDITDHLFTIRNENV